MRGCLTVAMLAVCALTQSTLRGENAQTPHHFYATRFPVAESPISEDGHWINGGADAKDWADVRTSPGLAFGAESGTVKYDDSTALLTGAWSPDQTAEATVHVANPRTDVYEEVELRLRSALSPHRATGYEINFRCSKTEKAYSEIVRWNGPLGDFTYLKHAQGAQYGVKDGDVVKATIGGDVITVYLNGAQTLQATDKTFATGNPGIGFYIEGATSGQSDYGFSSFSASDAPAAAASNRGQSGPR